MARQGGNPWSSSAEAQRGDYGGQDSAKRGRRVLVQDKNLPSFRNTMRLVTELVPRTPDGLRIAEALDNLTPKYDRQEAVGGDVCCPLPFSLQDLCLFVVVGDLDLYPVELLGSLPRWLRHRLLSVLPALDLCRLENTPVATGVDVDAIWNSRWKEQEPNPRSVNRGQFGLVFRIPEWRRQTTSTASLFQLDVGTINSGMLKEIESACQGAGIEDCKLPPEKTGLLKVASDVLTSSRALDLDKAVNKLISVQGDVVFSNLLTSSVHQPAHVCQCSQNVWKKQVTGLAVNIHSLQRPYQYPRRLWLGFFPDVKELNKTQLTPHRLLPILYKCDPMELLTLLSRDCNLQPSTANIYIESISQSFLSDLCAERLTLDSTSSLPTDSVTCTSIVNHFLEKVIILRLQCDKYSNTGVMIGMIKAATVTGDNSQLKHLFCTMPSTYMDTVQTFSALFSLPNFHQLTLDVDEVYPLMLLKLLQQFMMAPCSHTQKLRIRSKKGIQFPKSLKTNQLASLAREGITIPSACSAQHKILEFSSEKEFMNALYLLLQLPTIRLKELTLVNLSEYYQYFHLCAVHPDLQATKLAIDVGTVSSSELATIQQDLVSLFRIPSLQKISISGNWGRHAEVKLGLERGLCGRSYLPPLRKVALELELANSYKMNDFRMLCDAIFSLPQLDNLKVVLGKGFADMMGQPGYEAILYKCWVRRASPVQLKSLCLQTYESTYKQLPLVTQELTFSSRPRRYLRYSYPDDFDGVYLGHYVAMGEYYDDDRYDVYDSDEYCGYDDVYYDSDYS